MGREAQPRNKLYPRPTGKVHIVPTPRRQGTNCTFDNVRDMCEDVNRGGDGTTCTCNPKKRYKLYPNKTVPDTHPPMS
eukprot:4731906-Pyramimonas_sp.AAC.1